MADQRIGNRAGVVALNAANGTQKTNTNGSTTNSGEHDDADYASITALKARLTAIDAGYYTATRLNKMTYNDLVYAVRVNDSPASIK